MASRVHRDASCLYGACFLVRVFQSSRLTVYLAASRCELKFKYCQLCVVCITVSALCSDVCCCVSDAAGVPYYDL